MSYSPAKDEYRVDSVFSIVIVEEYKKLSKNNPLTPFDKGE